MIKENRRLWKLILLSIVTLGIYNIVFWFQVTRDLNEMNREEKKLKNYILVVFLSIITLGIYRWVWFFYVADRIQVNGQAMGMRIKPGPGTTLFWRLFGTFILIGPLVSDFMVIRNMNKIAKQYNQNFRKNTTVVRNSEIDSQKDNVPDNNSNSSLIMNPNTTSRKSTTAKNPGTPSRKSTTTKNPNTTSGKNTMSRTLNTSSGKNTMSKTLNTSSGKSTNISTTSSSKR